MKKLLKWGLIGLVGVIVLGAIVSSGDDATTDDGSGTAADGNDGGSTSTEVGQPARDGKFEFVVEGVDCGQTQIGPSEFGQTAQGQFCMLRVSVTNIGTEAQSLVGDAQKMFDGQGREFSADTGAAIYLDDSNSLFETINPGNTLQGVVVFDIPQDATPVRVELHDSHFSGGVTVNL